MGEEEIKFRLFWVFGACQNGGRHMLRLFKLRFWIRKFPCVPVFQESVFAFLNNFRDVSATVLVQAIESLVVLDLSQDLEQGWRLRRAGLGVYWIVNVLVEGAIEARPECERLNRNGP